MEDIESFLEAKGLRPTPNRMLVARALAEATSPMSLLDLETRLDTVDRSSVFRTLSAFVKADIVHEIDDGSKSVKYELCHASGHDHDDDRHVHFHCLKCQRTYCLDDIPVPGVRLPDGYTATGVNFVVKGICKACSDNL